MVDVPIANKYLWSYNNKVGDRWRPIDEPPSGNLFYFDYTHKSPDRRSRTSRYFVYLEDVSTLTEFLRPSSGELAVKVTLNTDAAGLSSEPYIVLIVRLAKARAGEI